MRKIKNNNINTNEYWDGFATDSYMQADINRGGSICKFNTVCDILPKNSDILDIGCLNGNLYNFLKNKNISIKSFTGIDLSEKLINLAKTRFPKQSMEVYLDEEKQDKYKEFKSHDALVYTMKTIPLSENKFIVNVHGTNRITIYHDDRTIFIGHETETEIPSEQIDNILVNFGINSQTYNEKVK